MLKRDVIEGYRRFRSRTFPKLKRAYKKLAKEGQHPGTLVISCSDSRVAPSTLLSAEPGEIFVIRNVANIVPPYSSTGEHASVGSAIEYAVRSLGVDSILIIGHAGCGGMAALLDHEGGKGNTDYVHKWVDLSRAARGIVLSKLGNAPRAEKLKALEEENIRLGLQNLMTYPWISERVEARTLSLQGARFDIEKGILFRFTPATDQFEAVG